jgi:hypothetical protein
MYLKTDDGVSGPIPEARWVELEFGNRLPRNALKSLMPDGPWVLVYTSPTSEEIQAKIDAEEREKKRVREMQASFDDAIANRKLQSAKEFKGNAVGGSIAIVVFVVVGAVSAFLIGPFAIIPACILGLAAYSATKSTMTGD